MFNPNVAMARWVQQPHVYHVILLLARIALAWIFITSGWGKLSDYAGTAAYMQSMQVSASLLPLVIFAELGGGLAILLGFQTRLAAIGLAVFSVLTAVLFHAGDDSQNTINFMKNIAMMGGFLTVLLTGAGRLSIDHILEK